MRKKIIEMMIIIIIIIIFYRGFNILGRTFSANILNKNLIQYKSNEKYSFLLFDDTVANITDYEKYIDNHKELIPLIKTSGLRIVISEKSINDTVHKLLNNNNTNYNSTMNGLYFKNHNLITIKNYNAGKTKIIISKEIRDNAEGDYKEFIKNKDSYLLSELYNADKLSILNNEINSNLFYHELGHFIVKESKLKTKKYFNQVYNDEKDKIFPLNNYHKSSIDEYIAECISNYLNYGYVEFSNKDLVKNSTKTGNIVKVFLEKWGVL